jgi:hypothetical protein
MAKRRRQQDTAAGGTDIGSGRVVEFAEDLGRILGTTQKRAEDWLNQRHAVAAQLTQIRDAATKYLQQLSGAGAASAVAVRRGRRGRPRGTVKQAKSAAASDAGTGSSGRKRRRRHMTAAQRKAVGDRMRKYWAARRKSKNA